MLTEQRRNNSGQLGIEATLYEPHNLISLFCVDISEDPKNPPERTSDIAVQCRRTQH